MEHHRDSIVKLSKFYLQLRGLFCQIIQFNTFLQIQKAKCQIKLKRYLKSLPSAPHCNSPENFQINKFRRKSGKNRLKRSRRQQSSGKKIGDISWDMTNLEMKEKQNSCQELKMSVCLTKKTFQSQEIIKKLVSRFFRVSVKLSEGNLLAAGQPLRGVSVQMVVKVFDDEFR